MYRRAFLCLGFLGAAAHIATGQEEKLVTRLSPGQLEKVFDEFADGKIQWQRTPPPYAGATAFYWITFPDLSAKKVGGFKATVMIQGDRITMYSLPFLPGEGGPVSFARMNEWNRRFGTSASGYLNKDSSAVLCTAHDMEPGTNERIIGRWLKVYSALLQEFERFARDGPDDTVFSKKSFEKVLDDMKIDFKRRESEHKGAITAFYDLTVANKKVTVSVPSRHRYINVVSDGIKAGNGKNISLAVVNEWNKFLGGTSVGCAYVEEGRAFLTSRHEITADTTNGMVRRWLEAFIVEIPVFEAFVRPEPVPRNWTKYKEANP